MIGLVESLAGLFVLATGLAYLLQRGVFSNLLPRVIVDPLITTNASISLAIGFIITAAVGGLIDSDDVANVLLQYVAFFGCAYYTRLVILRGGASFAAESEKLAAIVDEDYEDDIAYLWVFVIALSLVLSYKVVYGAFLIRDFGSGDARLLLNRQFRGLTLPFDAIDSYVSLAVVYYAIRRKRAAFLFVCLGYYGVSMLTGSKGIIINFAIYWILFDSIYTRRIGNLKAIILMAVGVVAAGVIFFAWNRQNAAYAIFERIIHSGDIYMFAFVIGDYTDLIGEYGFLSYLLHPISSLVGIRGYDFPIGASIIGTAGFKVTGTGPNPHLPIVNLVLTDNNLLASILLSAAAGVGVMFLIDAGLRAFGRAELGVPLRLVVLRVLYLGPLTLFLDVGYFQFEILKGLGAGLFVLFATDVVRTLQRVSGVRSAPA